MSRNPLVSIVIPCCNYGRYLPRAIDSALAQTYRPCEVIVVNDGSTDNTHDVCRSYGQRIVYVRKENGGVNSARNVGARTARGDWLQYLDADDLLDPQKIEVQMALHPRADVACIGCGWRLVSEDGAILARHPGRLPEHPLRKLLHGNVIASHCILLRKAAWEDVGPFDESLTGYTDWDYWLRVAARKWRFLCLPAVLCSYVTHPDSLTSNWRNMIGNAIRIRQKMDSLLAGDPDARELNRQGAARTWLRASHLSWIREHDAAASRRFARLALRASLSCREPALRATSVWTGPFGGDVKPAALSRAITACDHWARRIVEPLLRRRDMRRNFRADYEIWLARTLIQQRRPAMARFRLIGLILSGGALPLLKSQKSFILKTLAGPEISRGPLWLASFVRRALIRGKQRAAIAADPLGLLTRKVRRLNASTSDSPGPQKAGRESLRAGRGP